MATKIFSGRADAGKLAFADTIARERFGMSFGQYCGSVLLDAVNQSGTLPEVAPKDPGDVKMRAVAVIKSIAAGEHDESIGRMSDEEIRNLIGSRYE